MNKYVVRTSLVWLIILTATLSVVFFTRTKTSAPSSRSAITVEPIAAGTTSQPKQEATKASEPTAALAPLQLSPERMQSIGIETAVVERTVVTDDIQAPGTVAMNDRLLSYVQVRFSGYIRKVFANAPLQFVRQGDPLFTIYSPELVAAENEYLVALQNRMQLQSSTIEGVSSGAVDLVKGAEARLRQWDVPESVIRQVAETGSPVSEMLVTAPTSGYITERNALPNLYVEPATRLYTLADLSQVWVEAQLFPEDMGKVQPGADTLAHGRTFRVLTILDEYTRECLAIETDTSLPGVRVIRVLELLAQTRGLPEELHVDNGPEFVCRSVRSWCEKHRVLLRYIEPGRPMQNGHIESFNGRFRDDV